MALRAGDTLERYVIEGVLGHGGMGSVYRARDTRLNRRVALKVLKESAATIEAPSTGGTARIVREARAVAMLEHPNIVAIYDVGEVTEGEHAGTAYLAMELVDGRPLRGFVGDISIPVVTRIRWLSDVARGLAAAHDRAIVHRDVKPENVVVRGDGIVKVLDFGIAKQIVAPMAATMSTDFNLSTIAGAGLVVGTPYYMAPEQMRGGYIDAKADQFAWGVVAFELLSGALPWGSDLTPVNLIAAVLTKEAPDLHARSPEIPSWLSAIVARTLAKRPEDRYASMRDVIAALDQAGFSTAPTQAAPSSPSFPDAAARARLAPTVVPPTRRRSVRLAGAAALVALALAVVAFVARRAAPPAPPVMAMAPVSAAPLAEGQCSNDSDCAKPTGGPFLCVADDHRCAAIESEDCHAHADPVALASNDTIWFGELYPMTGEGKEEGLGNERAADLGRQDFAQALVALRAGSVHARPIALVACDDAANAGRAAQHLVKDLHVPAILGFRSGGEILDLIGSASTNQTLAVATMTTNPLITGIPRAAGAPPAVWRTTYGGTEAMHALASLIETTIEPELRAAGVTHTRVALVRPKSGAGALAVAERLFDALHFNGKSALENGADYRDFVFDPDAPESAGDPFAPGVERLRHFAPHVVVHVGGPAFVSHVLAPLEASWPATERVRPRYLSVSSFGDDEAKIAGHDKSCRQRFYGVSLPASTPVNARFAMHYNEVYGTDLARADVPGSDYDGFYLLAYASFALGDHPVTGPDLARAIQRLVPPGPAVEVGPSGIYPAFTRLTAGEPIDLNGAGGNLDFDVTTGEHEADLAILCLDVDDKGNAHGSLESGLTYVAHSGKIVGKKRCP